MRTELFDYALPPAQIARHPPTERDGGRLCALEVDGVRHLALAEFPELVPPGALVVLNDTRVRHARALVRRRRTGGGVELLFLERLADDADGEVWEALGRANKPLSVGDAFEAVDLDARITLVGERGLVRVSARTRHGVEAWLATHGHVPIPPYLGRGDEPEDRERYQTVFAERLGSVAAPTAGLHLSRTLLERLRERGVEIATTTLSIGLGTFRPVEVDDLDHHPMHAETIEVSEQLTGHVARARARGAPVVAIGTTVVRALESAADRERPGHLQRFSGETRLLIQPGYAFRVVNALLTNFHQPRSTLLALVCAFAGRDRVLAAYREALGRGYRFLSYGDAMWLPRRAW